MRKEYKLPELFDMHMGKTPDRNNSEYWENGTNPWISIADMTSNGKLITHTKEYITDRAIRETGIKPINYNTVIMSFKLSVGKVSKVATKDCPAYSNEAIMAFEIPSVPLGSPMILNDYAYYLLQSIDFTNTGNKAVMGKTLNKAILQNTAVKIHVDLDVQSEIITVLDKITDLIDRRKEQLEKLDELVKARFVELFGNVIRNDKGWEQYTFSDIATSRLGKMLDAKQQTGKYAYPYLANLNVQWFRFEIENLNKMDFNEVDRQEFELRDGDLLVCEGGEIGRCAVWHNEIQPCYFQKALHRVRCNQHIVLPDYMAWWFKYNCDHKGFAAIEGAKATIAHLPGVKLKALKVTVPPIELQNQFVVFLKQTDKSKLEVQKSLEKLELLKKALMQKYFG